MAAYLEDLLNNDGLDDIGQRDSVTDFLLLVMDSVLFHPGELFKRGPVEEQRVRPVDNDRQQQSQRLVGYE